MFSVARDLEGHLRNLENLQIYLKSLKSARQLTGLNPD